MLSHLTAAWIWRMYSAFVTPVWLTVPRGRLVERPGSRTTRRDLDSADLRTRHGMPLTSPPRTILDCASCIADRYELEAMVAEASFRGIVSEAELAVQVGRNAGVRGIGRLREVLDLPGGPQRTRNDGERAVLRFLRRRGFRGFRANHRYFGYELDFVWPDLRFAVEFDGWDGHSGRVAFERDRLKIATLQSVGVEVMPLTGRQLRNDPDGVAGRLSAALARRRREVMGPS